MKFSDARNYVLVIATAVAVAGCGEESTTKTVTVREPASAPANTTGADLPQGGESYEINPDSFTADVDNRYFPLKPGTQLTYREIDEEGAEFKVVVTVSSETREIANGVTARIVRDTVSEDGEIIEDTLDWYAQDVDGNVWYMGEDTAEFEDGKISSHEGAWEAGVNGALAGVIMPATPVDDMAYRQEYLKGEAEDNGEVLAVGEQAQVLAGHYDDVVITKDWITIEPKVLELKFYAPGVGMVLALDVSDGAGREELVKVDTVSDEVAQRAGTVPLGERYDS